MATFGQMGGGHDEQSRRRVDIAGLTGDHGGFVRCQDPFAERMVDRYA
jgi:hypothetical protein